MCNFATIIRILVHFLRGEPCSGETVQTCYGHGFIETCFVLSEYFFIHKNVVLRARIAHHEGPQIEKYVPDRTTQFSPHVCDSLDLHTCA